MFEKFPRENLINNIQIIIDVCLIPCILQRLHSFDQQIIKGSVYESLFIVAVDILVGFFSRFYRPRTSSLLNYNKRAGTSQVVSYQGDILPIGE